VQPRSQNFTFLLALSPQLEKIAGFADAFLHDAYEQTNQAIATNAIAYIRQQALGSPLESHAVRVEKGL
jgi:hypothetical protein